MQSIGFSNNFLHRFSLRREKKIFVHRKLNSKINLNMMAALRRKSDEEWIDAVNFLEPWWGKPPTNQPPVEEDHKRLKYAF